MKTSIDADYQQIRAKTDGGYQQEPVAKPDGRRAMRFKHPQSGYVEEITTSSYILAGVFGPLYLLFRQFWGSFLIFAFILQPILLGAFVLLGVFLTGAIWMLVVPDSPAPTFFVCLLLTPLYFVVTSKMIIGAIRKNLLRSGWSEV